MSWLNGPTAQRNSASGFPVLNYGEEFMTTVLCKPTFQKIIFLYLKRLHESQMCGLGKTNHFVQRLLWTISKNLLVSLELVIHFFSWQSNFCVSIVGPKWSASKSHSKILQRHPQWYCFIKYVVRQNVLHSVKEKYESCSGEIHIKIQIHSNKHKNMHKVID